MGKNLLEVAVQKPEAEALIPPWEQAGYSIEKAWQAAPEEDFDRSNYTEWLRRYDNPTAAEIATLTLEAQSLASQPGAPVFSLLMVAERSELAVAERSRGLCSGADLSEMGVVHCGFKPVRGGGA